jgi:hypothetical protein
VPFSEGKYVDFRTSLEREKNMGKGKTRWIGINA